MPAQRDCHGGVCPACAGGLAPWRSVPGSEPALQGCRYSLVRCARCGTAVTVGSAPGQLHESGAYRPGEPRLHGAVRPLLLAFDRQRLGILSQLVTPPARLLDAGAGRGRFVGSARAVGYDATGIEPSARGVDGAGANDGAASRAPVRRLSIEEAAIDARSLDAVTLWHVLEHVDDPGAALARIAQWLRPGGALLIGVPNIGSLQAQVGGERWYHLDVPRHRVHFTEAGLHELLRRNGFGVLRTRHVLLEHNPFGMWQSLVNRVTRTPSYLYNLLKRNAPVWSADLLATAVALPLAPIAAVVELLAGAAGRGGTIAVLARREPDRSLQVP